MNVDSSVARQAPRRSAARRPAPAAVWLGALALAALQTGCGQKGPLRMPAPAGTPSAAAPAAAPASAAPR